MSLKRNKKPVNANLGLSEDIKEKLRKVHSNAQENKELMHEVDEYLTSIGCDIKELTLGVGEYSTESLTFISYGEGDVEDNIDELELVIHEQLNHPELFKKELCPVCKTVLLSEYNGIRCPNRKCDYFMSF